VGERRLAAVPHKPAVWSTDILDAVTTGFPCLDQE
jgi:hypothetical protein